MLEAYAVETAALLKADRSAAIRRGVAVATDLKGDLPDDPFRRKRAIVAIAPRRRV